MKTSDFYYDLPQELIAQTPIEKRDTSRLMTLDRVSGATGHHHFYDLPDYLNPGDCLILNNSRVLPARLVGQRLPGGGICEVLLLNDRGDKVWECLVRPGPEAPQGHQTVLRQRGADRRDRGAAGGGRPPDPLRLRGHLSGDAGAAGQDAPAPLHQGGAPGPGAVSDRVLQGPGQRRRPHGGAPLHPGAAGEDPGQGRKDRVCDAPCGPGHLPARERGHH